MNRNRLKLNDAKTEFIIFGTPHVLKKVSTTSIQVGNSNIEARTEVRNIGAMFDREMKMNTQVRNMCRGAWLNLYNIGKIRNYLNKEQTRCVVHAFVTSKLDSNNSLLGAIPSDQVKQLERIQNAAAKVIMRKKKHDRVTPCLEELHWLPIKSRITFKMLLLTFKAINNIGPVYLKDLFATYHPARNLRSASDHLRLIVPKTRLSTYGSRAFSVNAAKEWNGLPMSIRSAKTVASFKSLLKTHLFKRKEQ